MYNVGRYAAERGSCFLVKYQIFAKLGSLLWTYGYFCVHSLSMIIAIIISVRINNEATCK